MSIYVYYVCVFLSVFLTESDCIPPRLAQYARAGWGNAQRWPYLARYVSTLQLRSLVRSHHRFVRELRSGGRTVGCTSGSNPALQQSLKAVSSPAEIVGMPGAGLHTKELHGHVARAQSWVGTHIQDPAHSPA